MKKIFNNIPQDFSFEVPTEENSIINEYLSHRIGMFISYGLTSFITSDSYATNYLSDPPNPTTFSPPASVDSAQWATEAANAGCDYAVLTTGHHIGFNIFPYTGVYKTGLSEQTYDSNRGQLQVPLYPNYDVSLNLGSDQNIVGKFVDQCAVEGIKCGLYYNIGKNINMRRGLDLIDATYDQTDTYNLTYDNYKNFVIDELRYILTTYTIDYLWLDAPHHFPRYEGNDRNNRRLLQDIYDACKLVNSNVLIIINYDCAETPNRDVVSNGTDNVRPPFTFDGTEMIMFPSDVISFEYFRRPDNNSDFNPITNHEGTDYYIGREIISSILTNGQYFARNDVFEALESAVTLQTKYDLASANNIPFLLSVAPAKNGVIPANQITRFNDIVL